MTKVLRIWLMQSVALVSLVGAAGSDEIVVERASLPRPFLMASSHGDVVDPRLEASAVEPIGDGRLLLVADDKTVALRVVDARTGLQVGQPITCDAFPPDSELGVKWEAMAHDEQGWYYIIGSHSGKTDQERQSHAHLYRFRLSGDGGDGQPIAIDPTDVRRWHVAEVLVEVLQREGLDTAAIQRRKIEGLSVRTVPEADGTRRTELVIGLREPDDLVRVLVADITEEPEHDASLALNRLCAFQAGAREGVTSQLTSLLYLPSWCGFFVITSTEDNDNVFHGNTLWFLPDDRIANDTLVEPRKVLVFEVAMKAEGLCALDERTDDPETIRLLVTYDNDAQKTHIPSRFQELTLRRFLR